jgi:nitrogen regulatory protein PII
MDFKLIVAVIKRGKGSDVAEAARQAGATGATITYARGTSIHTPGPFLGIRPSNEQEMFWSIVPADIADAVLEAVVKESELEKPGRGVGFIMALEKVVGLDHLEGGQSTE